MKTKRLGKGLKALIPEEIIASDKDKTLMEINVALVNPNPYQPRDDFDSKALEELKKSIRAKGLIQPITVRRVNGRYELIAGERRLRAVIEIGLEKIPAYIMVVETKEEMLELALIENVQREKLNPIEQATAFQRLISECNLTQDEVAQKIAKDRSTITNILRLLKLPKAIQENVKKGELSVGHARTLLAIENPDMQIDLCKKVLKQGISVRKLEKIVQDFCEKEKKERKTPKHKKKSPYIYKIEENLREKFGTKVTIHSRKEGGSVDIAFYSPEDLNRLMEIFDKIR
jgi:ParB family chromosome partitioning protein